MTQIPENKYAWVKVAAIPLITALCGGVFPFFLEYMNKINGIEDSRMANMQTKIETTVNSEQTIEALSKRIEEHNEYYTNVIKVINEQVEVFNEERIKARNSKAITLRVHQDGSITYTALDGNDYPVYWKEELKFWMYVKNGKRYEVFKIEDEDHSHD